MLSAYQAATAALLGDVAAYHPDCAPEGEELTALSRYTVASEWPEGLECDACGEWVEEPDSEYCLSHLEWAEEYDEDGNPTRCPGTDVEDPCHFWEV